MNAALLESLSAVGELAMRETGEAGYGLYRLDRDTGALVLIHACGASVSEFGATSIVKSAVSYATDVPGVDTHVLSFGFRTPAISEDTAQRLERIVRVVEGLLSLSLWPEQYTALAHQTAELEAQLASAKIRDRAKGLIDSGGADGVETLGLFAETILRRTETAAMLEQLVEERWEEVQERNLTTQAKAILESTYGMAEEQAHRHLRAMSRRNRRPLKEVALELIGKRSTLT